MQTAKQQVAGQMRTLTVMCTRLLSMSCNWTDVDCHFEARLEELSDQVNALRVEMDEFRKEKP